MAGAPAPGNWQSQVSDPLEKTTVHVADPAPPGAATVNVDVPVASTVLVWNPFWGVQAQLSEQVLCTTVQLVGPVIKLEHWAEDPRVSSDMA
jgi:hypothetical protein